MLKATVEQNKPFCASKRGTPNMWRTDTDIKLGQIFPLWGGIFMAPSPFSGSGWSGPLFPLLLHRWSPWWSGCWLPLHAICQIIKCPLSFPHFLCRCFFVTEVLTRSSSIWHIFIKSVFTIKKTVFTGYKSIVHQKLQIQMTRRRYPYVMLAALF